MHKRTLAVLAVVAAAGAIFPFGLPKVAHAAPSVVSYNTIVISPLPIAQPGSLNPSMPSTNTVTMCVQPQENGAKVGVDVPVYLNLVSGLFTAPHAMGGSAMSGSTPLPVAPTPPVQFFTVATCTFANPGGNSGTVNDAVPVTYTGPSTVPLNGRDVIGADIDGTSFNTATGTCTGAGACNDGTYVFSSVADYTWSVGPPIATTGLLTAGQKVTFTVTAVDGTGHAVPGAFLDLSLTSTASAGGTATAVNTVNGVGKVKSLTNFPTGGRFGADPSGSVSITYSAANPLPANGVDTITAQNHPTATVEESTSYTYATVTPPPSNPYTAVTPFRVCDTRPAGGGITANQCDDNSTGAGSGPIGQGATRVITVDNFGGVPASGVTAVVVNVTAIAPTKGTFLSLFPDGTSRSSSNLNPQAGAVVANLVEVGVSTAGKIDLFNDLGTINVAVDIEGYVSSSSTGLFTSTSPVRICDTRTAGGGITANRCDTPHTMAIGPGGTLTFNVDGSPSPVPGTGVSAVVFNLTAIDPTVKTVLTAFAGGTTRPTASNVNIDAHQALPNRVIVPVTCASGHCSVSIWNSVGTVNVAVDVDGWFTTGSGAQFTAVTPARICNTQFGNPSDGGQTSGCAKATIGAGHLLNIDVTGIDGVPLDAVAVVLNVTVVNATTSTFVTVYPGTSSRPTASDLNVASFLPVPNLVVAQVGTDGTISLFNDLGNVNLIVDVLGFYS